MSNANELRVKNLGILCEKIINVEIDFFQSKILERYDFEKATTRFKKTKE